MQCLNRTGVFSQEENQDYENPPGNTQNQQDVHENIQTQFPNNQNNMGDVSSVNSQQSSRTIEGTRQRENYNNNDAR